jgi:hypothetical protein
MNNVGPTKVVRSPPLRKFDLLPPLFRLYFKDAWADFDFEFVGRNLNQAREALGRPLTDQEVAKALDKLRGYDQEAMAIEAFAVYGADHPQAKPVPRAELRRRGLLRIFDEGQKWRGTSAKPSCGP